MNAFWDIITFRKMIAPVLLQTLFWSGIGGTIYGSYVLYKMDNWAWPLPLVFGPLLIRVLFEFWIIAFRSYDRLTEIKDRLEVYK